MSGEGITEGRPLTFLDRLKKRGVEDTGPLHYSYETIRGLHDKVRYLSVCRYLFVCVCVCVWKWAWKIQGPCTILMRRAEACMIR